MAVNWKTPLVLVGVLAGAMAQAQQERPEPTADELQNETLQRHGELPPDEDTLEEPGTGGAGDAGSPRREEEEEPFEEPGTGGAGDEPVLDEDEGVLEPGRRDEGLDHQDERLDPDTGDTREQPEG
jgi:hypothetical protein